MLRFFIRAMPSIIGILISVITRSSFYSWTTSSASRPFWAVTTSKAGRAVYEGAKSGFVVDDENPRNEILHLVGDGELDLVA